MNLAGAMVPALGPDASLVAALFAIDPHGTGGVVLRGGAGDTRTQWLALLRQLLPADAPLRRVPLNINDTALLGGLDLGATLQAGRPVAQQGVLAQADGGVVLLAMAERLGAGAAARLAAVLDDGEVVIERDGVTLRRSARLGMVALDEGQADDEQCPAALQDRLAFHLLLDEPTDGEAGIVWQAEEIARARDRLPRVAAGEQVLQALVGAAMAMGVSSLRGPLLALRVARAAAALAGADAVDEQHTTLAARLVLAPRATRLPTVQQEAGDAPDDAPTPPAPPPAQAPQEADATPPPESADTDQPLDEEALIQAAQAMAERVLEAAQAAIPAGLLAALKLGQQARSRAQVAGRAGAEQKNQLRGRPIGARRGEPRAGARLNVIETLRAAAPWQGLRARQSSGVQPPAGRRRIHVRREDFHVTRFRKFGQTTTVFVVDASGSSALNRLAEAKGAVELLLADCYVRRDQVAVLAFRGKSAELLLPPTRSLARAKRSLAGLPGGGGTPLAHALDAACELAGQISRRGETPIIVLLTDGKANIARDGSPGRAQAAADAQTAARQLRLQGFATLMLDTSPQPQAAARQLAQDMGASYLPLPYAGAQVLSQAVKAASGTSR